MVVEEVVVAGASEAQPAKGSMAKAARLEKVRSFIRVICKMSSCCHARLRSALADDCGIVSYWPDVVVVVVFLVSTVESGAVVTCWTTTLEATILSPSCV